MAETRYERGKREMAEELQSDTTGNSTPKSNAEGTLDEIHYARQKAATTYGSTREYWIKQVEYYRGQLSVLD